LKNIEEQKINKIRIVELCRKIVNIVVNKWLKCQKLPKIYCNLKFNII
jgi:hypothetical protein